MLAVIETGGKQYWVKEGDRFCVERLSLDCGKIVKFEKVLLLKDRDKIEIGRPFVKGAVVEAKVMAHRRGKKIVVFKMKRRKNYRRKKGHRQPFTEIFITKIEQKEGLRNGS
jgi:large subunit ribosomal protein L21